MLQYAIRTLSEGAVQIDSELATDDVVWLEGDARPLTNVKVTGRLSGAGSGRYYFSGGIRGFVAGECRRCLVPLEFVVQSDVHLIYVDADDETADEPDVYPLAEPGTMLDLRPAIREQWLLDASVLPLCQPDCKGLCPMCGAELNTGPCACTTSSRN